LWAYSVVLIRQLSSSVSTAVQMLLNNSVFLVLCAAVAPWRRGGGSCRVAAS
jgi:hypothetical protein